MLSTYSCCLWDDPACAQLNLRHLPDFAEFRLGDINLLGELLDACHDQSQPLEKLLALGRMVVDLFVRTVGHTQKIGTVKLSDHFIDVEFKRFARETQLRSED